MGSAYFTTASNRGRIGENYVRDYIRQNGFYPYEPAFDGSHPIDFYVTDVAGHIQFAVDVKTYPRRAAYCDTGIDIADWYKYAQIASKTPVRLFFIDYFEQCCYSVLLSDAWSVAYESWGKMYMPLDVMKFEFKLTESQLAAIVPAGNYRYDNTARYFDAT